MKTIAIIGGAGHVGLPLGLIFAQHNHTVYAIDNDTNKIQLLNNGNAPFKESGLQNLLTECLLSKNFRPVTQENHITKVEYVIITLATDLNEFNEPTQNNLLNYITHLVEKMESGQTLILRSTLLPGTMHKINQIIKNSSKNIFLSYCPERIQEGSALKELVELPQIIGAEDLKSFESCSDLFSSIGVICIKSNFIEAEIAKLFSNVWRYLTFSIANSFYSICLENNLSYSKIRELVTKNYPRGANLPRAQFTAGPCLLKDAIHLNYFLGNKFKFGQAAVEVNFQLCELIINDLEKKYNLSELFVGVLGMSFKPDSDDIRTSLSYTLRDLLVHKCKKVISADDLVSDPNLVSESHLLEVVDLIIISTPHVHYQKIISTKEIYNPWLL